MNIRAASRWLTLCCVQLLFASACGSDAATAELARCDDCNRLDAESTAVVSGPAEDYERQCRGCHRADGFGVPGAIPPLSNAMGLFLQVEGGREYLIRVPGVANAPIDDVRLAALLNWTLRRYSPRETPADFVEFSAEEIGRYRPHPLYEVQATRARLVEKIRRPALFRF